MFGGRSSIGLSSPQPVKVKGLGDEPREVFFSHHMIPPPFLVVAGAKFVAKAPVTRPCVHPQMCRLAQKLPIM